MQTWQMDSDGDTLKTSSVEGTEVRCYNTTRSIKLIASCGQVEAGAWLTRDQAIELIAILSRIVYSKAVEKQAEPAVVSKSQRPRLGAGW